MQGFHFSTEDDDYFLSLYTISRRACLDSFREPQKYRLDPSQRMFHMKMYHELRRDKRIVEASMDRYRVMKDGLFYIVSSDKQEITERQEHITNSFKVEALQHTGLYNDLIHIISEYIVGAFSVYDFSPKSLYCMPLSGGLNTRDINDWIQFVEAYSFFYRTRSLYSHLGLTTERPALTKEQVKFCKRHVISFDYRRKPAVFAFPTRERLELTSIPINVLYNMKVKDLEEHYIYYPKHVKDAIHTIAHEDIEKQIARRAYEVLTEE